MAGRAKPIFDFVRRFVPLKVNQFKIPTQARCLASSACVSHSQRTHSCGELRASHVGQEVVLCGWLMYERMAAFITVQDAHGVTQFIVPESKRDTLSNIVKDLTFESVLQIKGKVIRRPEGEENPKMPTGDIEVEIEDLVVLNPSSTNLPMRTRKHEQITEPIRLQYRYLDLRHPDMQRNLRIRSSMVMKMREYLCNKLGFVDVETPTLFRRTPGGAREFVVPTSIPGQFYSLPQSPQQFKQLLMVGGIDRYMQIAKCYRDEGGRPDRQPEFTQVDIEMSFINQEDIMAVIEGLLASSWPEESGIIKTPFPRMTYEDAMRQYGSDKPDTRFEMKIKEVTDIFQKLSVPVFAKAISSTSCSVHAVNIKNGKKHLSNKDIDNLESLAKETDQNLISIKMKEDLSLQGSIVKFLDGDSTDRLISHLNMEPGDLVFLAAGETYATCALLGRVRLKSTNSFDEEEKRKLQDPSALNFLWVHDFPLFLPKEDGGDGLESAHHPFTAPKPGQEDMLYTQPEKVQGQHYDLVLNGSEIGGGSIRIHNSKMQTYVLEEILKEDSSQLNHLICALDSGCPPHGGIALGLDRLVAIACQAKTIRDVIAFPKSAEGRDFMSGAPARISAEEQNYYHIKVTDDNR